MPSRRALALVVTALAAASLVACAGCDPEPPDARRLIVTLARAQAQCNPSFLGEAEPVFGQARLDANIEVEVEAFNRNLDNANVEFVRDAYDACLTAAEDVDCARITSSESPCTRLFRGKLGENGECAEAVECAPGLACVQELDSCGLCRPLATEGDDCFGLVCDADLFCNDQNVCERRPTGANFDVGDTCNVTVGCGGVNTGLNCKEGACAQITVVDEGEVCEVGPAALLYCKDSSTTHACVGDGEGGLVCAPRARLGDACGTTGCNSTESICQDGTCVDEGQVGDACGPGVACQLGASCEAEVCTAFDDVPAPPTCE